MLNIPYPYYVCSADECRNMDKKTIDLGIPGFTLMEIAGTRASDVIRSHITQNSHGLFFCGKGNNAGDALVVARLLSQQNFTISVFFADGTDDLSPDAQHNLELFKKIQGDINFPDWDEVRAGNYDFIVDGMFGTGLNSEIRPPYSETIEWINQQSIPTFALDVPSGLHADSGKIMGTAVQADYTLSFGALKTGFYLNSGFDHTGEITLCELSFPNKHKNASTFAIDRQWVDANSPTPSPRKHKYDGGVIYLIAGSEGLTGAASLTAQSAWANGAGAVIIITPRGLISSYQNLIQIIKKPIGDRNDIYFKSSHVVEVLAVLQDKPGKLIIGPGLGREPETIDFTQQILQSFEGDAVIDADALFALSGMSKWTRPASTKWILTPHPGELSRLLKEDFHDDYKRMKAVADKVASEEITILSKGLPSIVGTESGKAYLTTYDTRMFSRAGFGDVLAGKIGSFWLMYNSSELACFHALLAGHEKATQYFTDHSGFLEPLNII